MPNTQYLTDDEEEIGDETPEERALRLAQLSGAPKWDESDDGFPAPTASGPSAQPAMDDSGPGLSWVKSVDPANGKAVTAPAPQSNYDKAAGNFKDVLAQAPVRPEPKWWQRAAAAGAGALAGYSNAASRTRNPIDIQSMGDNILAPGYKSKLESWRSRVAPAQAELELAGQQQTAQQKADENKAKIAEQEAQTKMESQHGAYWQSRSEQERNQWKIDPKTGSLYNTITGAVTARPPTTQDRYDTAIALKATPDEAKYYALNGKLPPPAKAPAEKNMNPTDVLMHPQDFDAGTVKNAQGIFDRMHKPANVTVNAGSGGGGLDEEAINQAAQAYNAGAGLPNLGFGKESAEIKKAIINRAAKLKPGNDLAGAKQDYGANTGVLKDLEKSAARIRTSEGTASKNLDLAESVSQRVDRTGSPVLNKYLLYLKGEVAGDDDTQLLNNAVETAANEYAGVVTAGSGGGVAATDSAREHARQMLHSSMAKGTFTKVAAQMKQEMANRQSSFTDSLKQARSGRNPQASAAGPRVNAVTVTDPRGKIHTFADQAAADNFKKLAHIQ